MKELDSLIKSRDYDAALSLCNSFLEGEGGGEYRNLVRKRSHIYSLLGEYQLAIEDRLELIDQTQEEADVFFATLYLIRLEKFKDAYRLVNMGVAGLSGMHTPYSDELLFLRAYVLLKIELYQEAVEACGHIKNGMEMWISNFAKPISVDQIKAAAESRSPKL